MEKKIKSFDFLGNIAVVKFPKGFSIEDKKKSAKKILQRQKAVKTVLEKVGDVSGRLRKMKTKYLSGEKTKEVLYRENGCIFRFNTDSTYFSPRLSSERKEIASKIKKGDRVLVMFAGVGPYSIVIARNSPAEIVYSNEINREANKYAKLNIELNKVKDKVILMPGDIKKIVEKLKKGKMRDFGQGVRKKSPFRDLKKEHEENMGLPSFDVIVMPRPRLKDSFLEQAFMLSKKKTKIYYYDFCKTDEIENVIEKIKLEARKFKKKIKILKINQAGEIAPYKIRLRVNILVQ
ncbi:MAG TPA: hypothetical protein VJH65_03965 [Candidatus Nanoarchaeia archaeon]|nr:hypothetical protein [Candidatus Nanoarchaeia archaeon]